MLLDGEKRNSTHLSAVEAWCDILRGKINTTGKEIQSHWIHSSSYLFVYSVCFLLSRWISRGVSSSSTVRTISSPTARRAARLSSPCSPSPHLSNLQPSWKSGQGTWSSGPSTSSTSHPWPVTQSTFCQNLKVFICLFSTVCLCLSLEFWVYLLDFQR